jgi:restriction endonuclease Mrr
VMGQQANLKQVLTDERKGIISSETIRLNKNRIVYALLELLDEIDDELTSKGAAKSSKASPEIAKGFHFDGPINHLVIQQSSSGDNVVEKKEKVVEIGKDVQISAPITIADNIENSFNTLAKSSLNDEIKALLEQLLKAINEINKQAAPEHAEVAESMAREAEDLVKEATSAKPRRRWYEVSIEGLKQAATNIGEVATPVLEIVGKLTPLLSGQ